MAATWTRHPVIAGVIGVLAGALTIALAKRLYTLAAPGHQALRATLQGTHAMLQGLPPEFVQAVPR